MSHHQRPKDIRVDVFRVNDETSDTFPVWEKIEPIAIEEGPDFYVRMVRVARVLIPCEPGWHLAFTRHDNGTPITIDTVIMTERQARAIVHE